MTTRTASKAQVFNLKMPLLSEGMSHTLLAHTESMRVHGKVYAEGGENALHCHANEDHMFLVLDGQATFHDQDGNTTVINKYEGILLPRGAYYRFQSSGDTNLVMLRVGATLEPHQGDNRLDPSSNPFPSSSPENKQKTPVPIPGKFFGQ